MAKRTDLHKIMIIGSGPIVIGQAAEFDYAGTQACLALKEEGYEVILANSNPATIMTDTSIADKVYMEPLTLEYIARILRKERPDAIIPGIGGQTGLNLVMQLEKKGVLRECQTELLGTSCKSIEKAEDRELFKELCEQIGEPVIPSQITYSLEESLAAAEKIGYPVVVRPAFTLGGTGGGFADDAHQLAEIAKAGLKLSPVHQLLIEKSVKGYKEIEFEVMRDGTGLAIPICGMENIDPVGVHTGDSAVVAPIMTLTSREETMLRESALKLIQALEIEGGCNVQFALHPTSGQYYLIEVNPRVSRSSALASKASGYPIARVTAKIAVGMTLEEIPLQGAKASRPPRLTYVITKLPRFPFDKFTTADNTLSTQMKATGEVMGIGSTLTESLLKAVRSLEIGACHLYLPKFKEMGSEELEEYLTHFHDDNLFAAAALLRLGASCEKIHEITAISLPFLNAIRRITDGEALLAANPNNMSILASAKRLGISDKWIAASWNTTENRVRKMRVDGRIFPVFRMVDTMQTGAPIPYYYSSYWGENESIPSNRDKKVVLGAGPIRIGQGVEFDYSTVHAVTTIRNEGCEAIIINNNPETVSTDYTVADKLYFEPLTAEDVFGVLHHEHAWQVIASLGGQTAINLAAPLAQAGAEVIGTDVEAINRAEDRDAFEKLLADQGIPQPPGTAVTNLEDGVAAANHLGYPVLVRPSFVLGGRAMEIVANEKMLRYYLKNAVEIDVDKPVLVDRYITGREVEVDAICDGRDVFVPGIMELVERTGIHSGDSVSVYPPFTLSEQVKKTVLEYTKKLGLSIGIRGLYNIQFIVDPDEKIYIIEVNPRSSRTVPFLSKSTGYSLADIATKVILGKTLRDQGITTIYPEEKKRWYVKVPVFSFRKLSGMDSYLSPEMKSTGEAIGYDHQLHWAMYKAMQAAGIHLQNYGTVLVTVADEDKPAVLPLVKRFYDMGFNIEATTCTADYLKAHGIRCRKLLNINEGSEATLESIRSGYVSYVINTRAILSGIHYINGAKMRRCAVENGVTTFTSLDTVSMVLDVLEEITNKVTTIDDV